MSRRGEGWVFVGNLPSSVRTSDLDDLFHKFGEIRNIDLKNSHHGTPFAFVEFDDPEDARYAVKDRDNYSYKGNKIRVEYPHSKSGSDRYRDRDRDRDRSRERSRSRDSYRRSSRSDSDYKSRYDRPSNRPRYPITRRSDYRVVVKGLPRSGSWQDLKDHMRSAGDVVFADVSRDCVGYVEFGSRRDMETALSKLDGSRFKSHEGEESEITVKECDSRRRSYSSSRSGSRSKRSVSRSSRSDSRRSKSRSESRSKSRSREVSQRNGSKRTKSKSPSSSASPKRKARRSPSRSDSGSPQTSPARKRSADSTRDD